MIRRLCLAAFLVWGCSCGISGRVPWWEYRSAAGGLMFFKNRTMAVWPVKK